MTRTTEDPTTVGDETAAVIVGMIHHALHESGLTSSGYIVHEVMLTFGVEKSGKVGVGLKIRLFGLSGAGDASRGSTTSHTIAITFAPSEPERTVRGEARDEDKNAFISAFGQLRQMLDGITGQSGPLESATADVRLEFTVADNFKVSIIADGDDRSEANHRVDMKVERNPNHPNP
jgi:hypothetical protein